MRTIGKKPFSLLAERKKKKHGARAVSRVLRAGCGAQASERGWDDEALHQTLKESAWHNGSDPSGKRYLDWEILFRSNEQMVKWLDDDNFAHREAAS